MYVNIREKCLKLRPYNISYEILYSSKLFVAIDETGETVAGTAFMFCERGTRLIARAAASKRYDPNKKTVAGLAHALLIWKTIEWAKKKKMKIYDFGGYNLNDVPGSQRSRVLSWKKSFGGVVGLRVC